MEIMGEIIELFPYYNRKKHTRYLITTTFCKVYLKKYNFFKKSLANAVFIGYTVKAVT